MENSFDVVVVGGGLAGLAAAAGLARRGLSVALSERSQELGGRARTTLEEGFSLNLGAHALYRHGPAWRALEALEVRPVGQSPSVSGGLALSRGALHALPTGLVSLLSTSLLSLAGKLELSRVLTSLERLDTQALARTPAASWIAATVRTREARELLGSLLRLATYTGDLEQLSAGAALEALRHTSRHNVLYLDGGWQSLVDALRQRADQAGVRVLPGNGATRVERRGDGRLHVVLREGAPLAARAVVLATAPRVAARLLPRSGELERHAAAATPVCVATLDVALRRLPVARHRFALGTERPLYFSVHSSFARLGPEGGAVVHVMSYGPEADAGATERELEATLEQLQPGWRDVLVHRRFLPSLVASNDLVSAARGGLSGRPAVSVSDEPGVFLAGDWVGGEGLLLDASLASATEATATCAAFLAPRAAPARARAESSPAPAVMA